MAYNVKPGDKAVIIGSVNGPNGLSVGRHVLVHANAPSKGDFDDKYSDKYNALNDPCHYCPPTPYEKEHTVWGKIWPVTDLKGGTFATEMGHLVHFVDVPDRFLRRLVEEESKISTTTSESDAIDKGLALVDADDDSNMVVVR